MLKHYDVLIILIVTYSIDISHNYRQWYNARVFSARRNLIIVMNSRVTKTAWCNWCTYQSTDQLNQILGVVARIRRYTTCSCSLGDGREGRSCSTSPRKRTRRNAEMEECACKRGRERVGASERCGRVAPSRIKLNQVGLSLESVVRRPWQTETLRGG